MLSPIRTSMTSGYQGASSLSEGSRTWAAARAPVPKAESGYSEQSEAGSPGRVRDNFGTAACAGAAGGGLVGGALVGMAAGSALVGLVCGGALFFVLLMLLDMLRAKPTASS